MHADAATARRGAGVAHTVRGAAVALAVGLAAGGCYGPPVVPVSERDTSPPPPETRTVRRGDTLYNIAWENDLDYRDIAAWNDLSPPFVIRPGQVLRLRPRGNVAAAPTPSPAARPVRPAPTGGRAPRTTDGRAPAQSDASPEPQAIAAWSWPASGGVIARFSDESGNKGIDIAGAAGSPIRAAAPGEVVYAGDGLRGYGQLTIIKHDTEFLSAYAHQSRMRVAEGDRVQGGQVIGEMGATGTDRTRLHFEIRRNGRPVDPLAYLPARRG